MTLLESAPDDHSWSSRGLGPREALRCWQDWASETLAPMRISIPAAKRFAAHWRSHALGRLRLLELDATPQWVVHMGEDSTSHGEATFQLVYCMRTPIVTRIGAAQFLVKVGDFVLVDNARSYEMRMDCANKAIDLIIPGSLLERWLPDPHRYVGRPFSGSTKWGLPLASFLTTAVRDIEHAALPRTVIADQVGPLLALAVGYRPAITSGHRAKLIERALRMIEERHSEPELDPSQIAKALGISKRYLHAVLAEAGTTFLGALNRVRLARASELLADPRFAQHQVSEISWQCGYLDPSYFARLFRRHFGVRPREWRNERQR